MSRVNNSSSSNSFNVNPAQIDLNAADDSPNYGKAALYITIATIAAIALAGLIVCSGGGVIIAGFMFSIGLAIDGVAILAGTVFLAIFAGFMAYETYRLSSKADELLHPPGTSLSSGIISL